MDGTSSDAGLVALLGPTNTGKTHRAIRRMLGRRTGMIGLPLRLLAREVYERVKAEAGEGAVALVTGEEKRVPAGARYWVCTTESMPLGRPVDFLAVDEIQLAAHKERGHTFTQRLLHARGVRETWLLGAETMAPLVQELLPHAEIRRQPRLSQLRYAGACPLGGLPRRSAVVAFSVEQVYEIAEKLRRKRGGAAVVLGALSPRTRNAQVALYESGAVDYLVATDAIGMGLNLDVDHVAFAALRKWDGRQLRDLDLPEMAQIAGRAGRFRRDGTFGTVGDAPPLDPRAAAAIEGHSFAPVTRLVWRNDALDFSSVDALLRSLRERPPRRCFVPVDDAEDTATLARLLAVPRVREEAAGPEAVALLWELARIPDSRRQKDDQHAHLLAEIFFALRGKAGRVSADWLAERFGRLDRTDGDIEALTARIAWVRTWNTIVQHAAWLEAAAEWQGRARALEERISDALHALLTGRFVDERGRGAVAPRPAARAAADAAGEEAAVAEAAGSPFAALARFVAPAPAPTAPADVRRARLEALAAAGPAEIRLGDDGRLWVDGAPAARLVRGAAVLRPELALLDADAQPVALRAAAERPLRAWLRAHVAAELERLVPPEDAPVAPARRALAFALTERLGVVPARAVDAGPLPPADRAALVREDVRWGFFFTYVARWLRPERRALRAALAAAWAGAGDPASLPGPGVVAPPASHPEAALLEALGYVKVGPRFLRVDAFEATHARLRGLVRSGDFTPPDDLLHTLGLPRAELPALLRGFGLDAKPDGRFGPPGRRAP